MTPDTANCRIMTNADVLEGKHPEAQCVSDLYARLVVRVGPASQGVHIITTADENPGVVLKPEHAAPSRGFLKAADFQAIHKGQAAPAREADVLAAYGMDKEDFLSRMRTVGCGTNVYVNCADGLYQLVVQRTAPVQTPEGVVQAGSYSRAAGGCTGDIQRDQMRELTEELCLFIRNSDGRVTSLDLTGSEAPISPAEQQALFAEKNSGIHEVFAQVSGKMGIAAPLLESRTTLAHEVIVPGLTDNVVQIFSTQAPRAFRSVVVDDASNGDISGIDKIRLIDLPNVRLTDIFIGDGERDFNGRPLERTWLMLPPSSLEAAQRNGSMKFSPAPGKVISHTANVVASINSLRL